MCAEASGSRINRRGPPPGLCVVCGWTMCVTSAGLLWWMEGWLLTAEDACCRTRAVSGIHCTPLLWWVQSTVLCVSLGHGQVVPYLTLGGLEFCCLEIASPAFRTIEDPSSADTLCGCSSQVPLCLVLLCQ
jgi:hypothetical protein